MRSGRLGRALLPAPLGNLVDPWIELRTNIEVNEMSSNQPMIEAEGLCKYYGSFAAVEDVSFSIARGEVVAFLGPNGAGKSTTMKILTGFLTPSKGVARIAGLDVRTERIQAAERLGYLPENGPLYPDMTPRAFLRFFAQARGMGAGKTAERLDLMTERCSLRTVLDKPIHKLSKGYRQRVGMAQALLHDPDVLILDEPTSGLDPNQIRDVRALIRELGETKTILLSTHILQEVEAVADRVVFISEGRRVYDGALDGLATGDESLDDAFHRLTRGAAATEVGA